jgi:hypothetical protein
VTDEKTKRLRALCEAATPGPWTHDYDGEQGYAVRGPSDGQTVCIGYEEDAAFIAAARTALPEVIDELERLRARILELEGLVSHTACTIDIWNSVGADGGDSDEMEQVLVDTSGMLKTALGGDPTKDVRDQPEILRHIPERAK